MFITLQAVFWGILAVFLFSTIHASSQPLHIRSQWNNGIAGYFLVSPSLLGKGWTATITCDKEIDQIEVYMYVVFHVIVWYTCMSSVMLLYEIHVCRLSCCMVYTYVVFHFVVWYTTIHVCRLSCCCMVYMCVVYHVVVWYMLMSSSMLLNDIHVCRLSCCCMEYMFVVCHVVV